MLGKSAMKLSRGTVQTTFFLCASLTCSEARGFQDVLPRGDKVCLLLQEFRRNMQTLLSRQAFPAVLVCAVSGSWGDDHDLAGRNHNALLDAQQLYLMLKVFSISIRTRTSDFSIMGRRYLSRNDSA